jgi:hypothetical protein
MSEFDNIERHPDRPLIHFGSPEGATYTEPAPILEPPSSR